MKFKIGGQYSIKFWDHCKGDGAVLCEVAMWIISEDKTSVMGTWWKVHDEDEATTELNRETVTIIKAAIVSKRKI
jgi:hypothetical protein